MARRKDNLVRSLAASLLLHVAVLSLQFGVPGMGMPLPGFAQDERKASIPTIKAVLRSSQAPAAIAQSTTPPVPVAVVRRPAPKTLKHTEPKVKKRAVGNNHRKPMPAKQPVPIVPTPALAASVPTEPMVARLEKIKEPVLPKIEREEFVKPVVKVEKQKAHSDEVAVLSTEQESSWHLNAASPNIATSEVQAEEQKERIAREAALREQRMAEEQTEQRKQALAQAQALIAEKAEERERASKKEAAAALEKAQTEAQALAAEKQKTEAQAALEKKRNEALLQAAAEEKIRQEQMALARERDEAERIAKAAALAREEESRRKEEQAALAKAKEDALTKAIQAEARAREQAAAAAAAAAAASAANVAAEKQRAADLAARNSSGVMDAKPGLGKQGGDTSLKGADLARRALDMARSGNSGLPVKAPVDTDRQRRGSILGRNPSDVQLAFYGESWTQKIERISSVNYPKLNRNILYGSLVLSVSINSDGSVAARRIVRSSGNRELDEAVLRIVDMCSPFAAFPPDLKRNYDVVEVTRTLSFPEKPPVIISQ